MKKKSAAALVICYILMIYTGVFYYPRWERSQSEATISWDVSGYYMYLPAHFIYKDIRHCVFKDSILQKYRPTPDFQQGFIHKASGNYVMKYSSGQSFLMAPFFALGHIIASHSTTWPADGFSFPYQICLGLGMLLYAFLGLFVLRKVLLQYFKDSTVALSLLALVAGTNYLNYAAIDQAMTHSTLFMVYALILWFTIQFYQRPRIALAALLGALCGFATLIRPTEIISIILPVLWGVSSIKEFQARTVFLFRKPSIIVVFGIYFALLVSIQLIYWKSVSGDWIVYSYQDQGFSWLHPHLQDYMIGYTCGWLRYCPMMIFAFVGVLPFIRRKRNAWAVILFSFINLYIVTAWDVWWFGGRAMVQSYAVMFFLIAGLIEYINEGSRWKRWIFYPLYLVAIYLNIWWTHNSHRGQVQVVDLSRAYYRKAVGRWSVTEETTKLLDNRDAFEGPIKDSRQLYFNDFETDSTQNSASDEQERRYLLLDKAHERTLQYHIPLPEKKWKWLRAFADVKAYSKEWDQWKNPQFIVRAAYQGKEVKTAVIRMHRFLLDNEERRLFLDMRLPDEPYDQLTVNFWNAGSDTKTMIDNVKVEVME